MTSIDEKDITPRIYVACLAAYNSGKLHGVWINATKDLDEIQAEVTSMLRASPVGDAEEWAIHDYEGFFGVNLQEYTGFETVAEIASMIEEYGELGALLISHFCGDVEEARRAMSENYRGEYKSVSDFAQELTEETTEIPKSLEYYIDYESMAHDMELNGDIFTIEESFNVVHVFWSF